MLLDAYDLCHLIAPGERVLVAVSGGADSVALLTEWVRLEAGQRCRLFVGHFDHRLRPESVVDADWVSRLSSRLGLSCEVGVADSPPSAPNGSIEAAARDARYAFLADAARRVGAACVATAHTQDDQVETIVFNILRGTGLRGASGMRASRHLTPDVRLVRPLLHRSRIEVRATLAAAGQDWREDSSNDQLHFTRNRIRKTLLPLLREEFNPRIADAVVRLGSHAAEAVEYVEEAGRRLLEEALLQMGDSQIELDAGRVASAAPVVRQGALRLAFERMAWPLARMGAEEWNSLAQLIDMPEGKLNLPNGVRAVRRGNTLWIERAAATPRC